MVELSPKERRQVYLEEKARHRSEELKQCPSCKEFVKAEASTCKFCGKPTSDAVIGIQALLSLIGVILIIAGIIYMLTALK